MSCERHRTLREEARALRLEGWSRADICRKLGMKDNAVFAYWIKDLPIPPRARTRRSAPAVKQEAIALRLEGRSYREIESVLGVARSTLSSWLKDVPLTDAHRAALADRRRTATDRRGDSRRARRVAERERVIAEVETSFGRRSERDLLVAGAVAYWAEGTKTKPWNPEERVTFTNSDPDMIKLFLDWLTLLGVPADRIFARVSIHGTADVERATAFWSNTTGIPRERFGRPSVKRHNPRSVRKNTGAAYVGASWCVCLAGRTCTAASKAFGARSRFLAGSTTRLPQKASADPASRI